MWFLSPGFARLWDVSSLRLIEAPTRDAYDEIVATLPYTSPLQAWGFGEARKVLGQEAHRFLIQKNGRTVGAIQILRKPLVAGFSLLYVPRGPVFENPDDLLDLPAAIKKFAKVTDLTVKIEPPKPIPSTEEDQQDIPESLGIWKRGKVEQPEHTIAVDLRLPEDQLLKNLHQMARRNVKTAQKLGTLAGRDDHFDDFWHIFEATNERAKLGQYPKKYYTTMLNAMQGKHSEAYIVLARHEGKALAGGFFVAVGKGTYYLYGGSVRDDRLTPEGEPYKDVKAPTAFYWNAMLDAKARGYEFFDFWGIPAKLSEDKHSFGVFKMKENFGGFKLWYPAYDLDLNPMAPAVRKMLAARKRRINLKMRGTAEDVL